MGLTVVLIALSLLAVMIIIFSKVFEILNNTSKKQVIPNSGQTEELTEKEIGAAIISVICEDLCTDPSNIRITSIREI